MLPPLGWIKISAHGAATGKFGRAGYGGAFQNCKGFVQGCFMVHLDLVWDF